MTGAACMLCIAYATKQFACGSNAAFECVLKRIHKFILGVPGILGVGSIGPCGVKVFFSVSSIAAVELRPWGDETWIINCCSRRNISPIVDCQIHFSWLEIATVIGLEGGRERFSEPRRGSVGYFHYTPTCRCKYIRLTIICRTRTWKWIFTGFAKGSKKRRRRKRSSCPFRERMINLWPLPLWIHLCQSVCGCQWIIKCLVYIRRDLVLLEF